MAKPYITALIDTYNHERFIEKAITSVLHQDFPSESIEILVVDDGSTDQTPEIVRKFQPRLRLIRKPNGGQASAFNVGIPQAQGEIVAFFEGDDLWAPRKPKEVSEAFEKNPCVGAVGHGNYEIRLNASENNLGAVAMRSRLSLDDRAGTLRVQGLRDFLRTSELDVRKEVKDHCIH